MRVVQDHPPQAPVVGIAVPLDPLVVDVEVRWLGLAEATSWNPRQRTAEGDTIIGARASAQSGPGDGRRRLFPSSTTQGDIVERKDASARPPARRLLGAAGRRSILPGRPANGKLDRLELKTNLRPEFVQEKLARPETIPFFDLPRKMRSRVVVRPQCQCVSPCSSIRCSRCRC